MQVNDGNWQAVVSRCLQIIGLLVDGELGKAGDQPRVVVMCSVSHSPTSSPKTQSIGC
jgi:hypothetical protein